MALGGRQRTGHKQMGADPSLWPGLQAHPICWHPTRKVEVALALHECPKDGRFLHCQSKRRRQAIINVGMVNMRCISEERWCYQNLSQPFEWYDGLSWAPSLTWSAADLYFPSWEEWAVFLSLHLCREQGKAKVSFPRTPCRQSPLLSLSRNGCFHWFIKPPIKFVYMDLIFLFPEYKEGP